MTKADFVHKVSGCLLIQEMVAQKDFKENCWGNKILANFMGFPKIMLFSDSVVFNIFNF